MTSVIYKIVDAAAWRDAVAAGRFAGAPVDLADGYIHFSTAAQVRETASKHFAGVEGLVLAAFDAASFGGDLKWEPSRGGALFPHLYVALDPAAALWTRPLPLDGEGAHVFPDGMT